ncbi:MAG: hypothetical protein A2X86_06850 [Bdellovibrionales bacterium GWA2_49_15]|nr:MAG: hypothetical protein A2X86_06850 [Bdellovibrionales bacterium GWA2_49_15]
MKHLILLLTVILSSTSCDVAISKLAGNFSGPPEQLEGVLTPEARDLIAKAMAGLRTDCVRDMHLHVAGMGHEHDNFETTITPWVNPKTQSRANLSTYLKFKIYLNAAGIQKSELQAPEKINKDYVSRIVDLWKFGKLPGKAHLLAFDKHYNEDGTANPEQTSFYMPNQTIWDLSQKYPEIFTPVISVHPYRKDAISELEKWGKLGVRFIKWLPNSMHIDPSRTQLDAYYDKVKELNMAILTHVGEERAVDGEQFQKLGNPLLYRRPLDKGVKIIMAHVASLGECEDFEQGGQKSCFQLFWRLFNEDKYKGVLYGELSAVTLHTRLGEPLLTILSHPELQTRLVNGSDYPLPAINWIYRTSQWKDLGYITESERESLNQIYHYNPLLFDFVSKRTLHHPTTGTQLRREVFYLPQELGGCIY